MAPLRAGRPAHRICMSCFGLWPNGCLPDLSGGREEQVKTAVLVGIPRIGTTCPYEIDTWNAGDLRCVYGGNEWGVIPCRMN